MSKYKYLKATDQTGPAILAHIQNPRSIGSTVLDVDSVDNWPTEFICTTGKMLASGFLDPATITEFRGHLSTGDVIIDSFEPGFADAGNTTDQVAIIKPTGSWADLVAEAIRTMMPSGVIAPYGGAAAPTDWLLCDGSSVLRATYPDLFAAIGTAFGSADGTHFNLPDLRGRLPLGAGQRSWGVSVANSAVDTATDQITVTANDNLKTGKAVVLTTTGGAPAGLTAGNTYYLIIIDSTHIKLATSLANAVAGTAIDLTSQGTGTHTLTFTGTNRAVGVTGGEDVHSQTIAEMPSHFHITHPGNVSTNTSSVAGTGIISQSNDGNTDATGGSGAQNVLNPYTTLNYIIKT